MIQQLDLCVEHLICAFCDLEACHMRLVGLHLPDHLESSFWVLNEMTEEVKDAIRGYSSPSSLSMFNLRHKWPDIMGKSLKFPRFPSKLPTPSPRESSASSTTPSSCSPRTCPSMPPTPPQSMSGGAARPGTLSVSSVRPGWRASSPPGTGMGNMPTPTYPRGSFRSPAEPGCKARMRSGLGRTSSPGMGIRRGKWPSPSLSSWRSSRE